MHVFTITYVLLCEAFVLWCNSNKPKHGPVFKMMLKFRAHFKYALKYCKKVEKHTLSDKLATELSDNDYVGFWKEINKLNEKRVPLASNVGGASGSREITEMYFLQFCS